MLKIVLPFPPSVNALFGGGSGQKRFPTKQYKAWLEKVKYTIAPHSTLEKAYIQYCFYFPDKRTRDSQNYIKAVTDQIVKSGLITDDNWLIIKDERITPMGIDRDNPRVEVFVSETPFY